MKAQRTNQQIMVVPKDGIVAVSNQNTLSLTDRRAHSEDFHHSTFNQSHAFSNRSSVLWSNIVYHNYELNCTVCFRNSAWIRLCNDSIPLAVQIITEIPGSHLGLCPEPCADEHKKDTSVLRAIFACDIATILNLSQQIIAYAQMRLYVPTLPLLFDRLGKFNPLPYRIQPGCIAGKCQKADTLAVKTIRLRMRYVEPLLNYDPNIKVVYYSRDPRGIMSSLTKLREVHSNTIAGMCAVMEDDFKYYKLLKASYPNRVRWVRYEDLALNTAQVSRDIYNFSTGQECVPRSVQSWIAHNTQVPRSEYTGITGTKRNSSANAREWKKIISDDRKQEIERTCSKVLTMLKYNADY
ncbi:hypothetical protein CAPTEDRAFT_198201 [Capitella teleta]|uniref:Sulfotransferase domain-containing protein n=1 Tax=Capitella teleta TaxID=283909 RepID=X1ZYD5_CAPTE|nr:hypothetical protein CAPTEDRAFT_198201 [Capitella teleta]|eukprot:ELU04738.1 hypothetical protein CAPTEDRAFT_198201 [Capitella teleta]